jgi:GNAT superfamily N-acetyltransferase
MTAMYWQWSDCWSPAILWDRRLLPLTNGDGQPCWLRADSMAGVWEARVPKLPGSSPPTCGNNRLVLLTFMPKLELADVFVEEWLQQGGQTDGLAYRFNMMVFNPDTVRPTTPAVDGSAEVATHHDLSELATHAVGFYRDALAETRTVESQIERLRPLIVTGHVHLWRNSNGQIASQAECTSPSFNSASVGCVYTPEQYRGRGYAGALVGHLSRRLAEKRLRVTLFADSKAGFVVRLYEKTGYETKAHIHRYDTLRVPS